MKHLLLHTMVTFDESLAAYRALPNAEFQVFPNTPHPFDKASPQLLAVALLSFFD